MIPDPITIAPSSQVHPPSGLVSIDGYLIDAALSEQHQLDADITEHPVETGSDIADHRRVKPRVVTISGIVSDSPLGRMAAIRRHLEDGVLPSEEAAAKLEALFASPEPVTLVTQYKVYDDMLIQSLHVPRDQHTGFALRFDASFKQVIFKSNERTLVPVATPTAGAPVKLRERAAEQDDAATTGMKESLANHLVEGVADNKKIANQAARALIKSSYPSGFIPRGN